MEIGNGITFSFEFITLFLKSFISQFIVNSLYLEQSHLISFGESTALMDYVLLLLLDSRYSAKLY